MTERRPQPATARSRVRFAATQTVGASPDQVFPLLCPVREYDWVPGWDCRLVYTESGLAEDGCVFQTDRPADGGVDTWVVSHFEPGERIGFVRVNPLRAIRYDVLLAGNGDGTTSLEWRQEITALNEDGDRQLASLKEDDFVAMIGKLETLLDRYLATGTVEGAGS